MERDCKKCIHHISGSCDAWECNMESLEDYRAKVIDEFAEQCKKHIFCQTFGLKTRNIDEIAEQLKGVQNE